MELLSYAFNSKCKLSFRKCKFKFEGLELILYAGNEDNCEVIQVVVNNSNEREKTFQIINKFLNSFGWANYCSFEYEGYCVFGLREELDLMKIGPRFQVPRNSRNLAVNFEVVAKVPTNELEIALSLFNEAKFTHNIFHKFFCFWKILSIRYPNRSTKNASDYINQAIQDKNVYKDRFIKELLDKKINVGKHLYENFRCAIAHITRKPVKLSFNEKDFREVSGACNSIEHFVQYFIRNELGLPKYCDRIDILEIK